MLNLNQIQVAMIYVEAHNGTATSSGLKQLIRRRTIVTSKTTANNSLTRLWRAGYLICTHVQPRNPKGGYGTKFYGLSEKGAVWLASFRADIQPMERFHD